MKPYGLAMKIACLVKHEVREKFGNGEYDE